MPQSRTQERHEGIKVAGKIYCALKDFSGKERLYLVYNYVCATSDAR